MVQDVTELRVAEQASRRAAAASELSAALAQGELDPAGTAAQIAERVVSIVGDVVLVSPGSHDDRARPAKTVVAAREGEDVSVWSDWVNGEPTWTEEGFLDGALRTGKPRVRGIVGRAGP